MASSYRSITGRTFSLTHITKSEREFLYRVLERYGTRPSWADFTAWTTTRLLVLGFDANSVVALVCGDLQARLGIAEHKIAPPDERDRIADLIREQYGSAYKFAQSGVIDKGQLSRYLSGKEPISGAKRSAVLEKLGVSERDWLHGNDQASVSVEGGISELESSLKRSGFSLVSGVDEAQASPSAAVASLPGPDSQLRDKHETVSLAVLLRLQQRVTLCLKRSSYTLIWYSQRFRRHNMVPRNIWSAFDRPLPRETFSLRLPFGVWDALLAVERALRADDPVLATELARESSQLKGCLQRAIDQRQPTRSGVVARLASDEVYGTFNALSAAAVLRSEVVPDRSAVTPSYLAGHILVSELKIANKIALASPTTGMGRSSPRIALAAQGVNSLMLFVDHLRTRAIQLREFAGRLKSIDDFKFACDAVQDLPPQEKCAVEDRYLRVAMLSLLCAARELASLMLTTRPLFHSLEADLRDALETRQLSRARLEQALASAVRVEGLRVSPMAEKQRQGYRFATAFAYGLSRSIRQVRRDLELLLSASRYEQIAEVVPHLARSARRLHRKHTKGLGNLKGQPTIGDTLAFQFVQELLAVFVSYARIEKATDQRKMSQGHEKGSARQRAGRKKYVVHLLPRGSRRLREKLTVLCERYNVFVELSQGRQNDPCLVLNSLGATQVAKTVLTWWRCHEEGYAVGAPGPIGFGGDHWLRLRHRSFMATETLVEQLVSSHGDIKGCIDAATAGAGQYAGIADEVHLLLKQLTSWCREHGTEVLSAASGGLAPPPDVHELTSSMWLADRLGEPWSADLEERACRTIASYQHADGSFPAGEPSARHRGLILSVPSAETISVLFRFATGADTFACPLVVHDRVMRWSPVLIKSAAFLAGSMVGKEDGGWAGWHTDRDREIGRIDCAVTNEAVIAVAKASDVLRLMIDMRAADAFRVEWPGAESARIDVFDWLGGQTEALAGVTRIVSDLRVRTGRYLPWDTTSPGESLSSYSLLLCGPPSSGKTDVQHVIAAQLGWPLVVVEPEDISDDSEKAIDNAIDSLSHLSNVCIAFRRLDEIVSRGPGGDSTPDYEEKVVSLVARLRKLGVDRNCLVMFVTGRGERLTSAVRRVGHSADVLPTMYPSASSRLLIILRTIANSAPDTRQEWSGDVWAEIRKIVADTALCDHGAVCGYIQKRVAIGLKDPSKMDASIDKPIPVIDCSFYRGRRRAAPELRQVIESIGNEATSGARGVKWRRFYKELLADGTTGR